MLNLGNLTNQIMLNEDDIYIDNLIMCMDNAFEYYDTFMGFDDEISMEKMTPERLKRYKELRKIREQRQNKHNTLKDELSSVLDTSASFFDNSSKSIKKAPLNKIENSLKDFSKYKSAVNSYKLKVLSVWLNVLVSKNIKDWKKVEQSFISNFKSGKPIKFEPLEKEAEREAAVSAVSNVIENEITYIKRIRSFLIKLEDKSDTVVFNAIRRFLSSDYSANSTNKQIWQKVQQAQNKEQMIISIRQAMKYYRDKLHCIHMWVVYARNFIKENAENRGKSGAAIVKTFLIPAGVKREMEQLVKEYTGVTGSWKPKLKRIVVSSYRSASSYFDGQTVLQKIKPITDSKGNILGTKAYGNSLASVVIFPEIALAPGIVPLASIILHEVYHAIDMAKKSKSGKEWKRQQQWDENRKAYNDRSEEERAYKFQYQFVADVVDGKIPRTSAILAWARNIKQQIIEEAKRVGYDNSHKVFSVAQRKASMKQIVVAGRALRDQK